MPASEKTKRLAPKVEKAIKADHGETASGPAASEEANELGSLGTPAATNLECKDTKLRAQQLGVRPAYPCMRGTAAGADGQFHWHRAGHQGVVDSQLCGLA